MLRFGKLAVLILTFFVMVPELSAQDVKIGNGRLLKKWRDDLLGNTSQNSAGSQQNQRQQPTPASSQRTSNQQVQQAPNRAPNQNVQQRQPVNSQNFRQPTSAGQRLTPAQQQYQMKVEAQRRAEMLRRQQLQGQNPQRQTQQVHRPSQQPSATNQADYYRQRGSNPGQTATFRQAIPAQSRKTAPQPVSEQPKSFANEAPYQSSEPSAQQPAPVQTNLLTKAAAQLSATQKARRRGPPAVGFGLELATDKNEKVYVSDVERNGNAANAGIKKGDYVLEIGGAKLGSAAEFDEIVKVMSNGDQLELKVSRRGRESDVMLTFGEAAELPDEPAQQTEAAAQSDEQNSNIVSDPQTNNDRFEFVPPAGNSNQIGESTPTVDPDAFDAPSPADVEAKRPELPELDLDLPEIPQEDSVLDID